MTTDDKKPIFDDKVEYILEQLKEGKSRQEIAKDLDYKNYKSMDMYIRRRNFRWDSNDQMYYPEKVDALAEGKDLSSAPAKVAIIISMLEKNGDPKEIAYKTGFTDHLALAEFMKKQGYLWSSQEGNYTKKEEVKELEEIDEEKKEVPTNTTALSEAALLQLGKHLPLLELLSQNKERLEKLLSEQDDRNSLPRYVLRGKSSNKTVYMSRLLRQMLEDFSRESSMSQREIVEIALVDFFRNYGYDEVESIILEKEIG